MEAWEMREWFQEFLDALNRHDLAAIREFLASDVRRAHLPAGADAWLEEYADLLRGFPDWQWRRIQVIVEEDRLAVHLRGSGAHTGPYAHTSPTRRRVSIASFAMYRISGGRIVEASGTDDALTVRTAVM
ncbi:ester cyclase [Microbacterium enclense]|uniref:Ester cyclase n=1 Tax=Microbacterium enclense TaxID=993073 RepID=A0A3S3P234_9MICO|nr:ester cyclase [Microbacterium enclense]RWR15896.1 ester cyclase [Microbacterium enclense]